MDSASDTNIFFYADTLDASGYVNNGVYLDFMFVYDTPNPNGALFTVTLTGRRLPAMTCGITPSPT